MTTFCVFHCKASCLCWNLVNSQSQSIWILFIYQFFDFLFQKVHYWKQKENMVYGIVTYMEQNKVSSPRNSKQLINQPFSFNHVSDKTFCHRFVNSILTNFMYMYLQIFTNRIRYLLNWYWFVLWRFGNILTIVKRLRNGIVLDTLWIDWCLWNTSVPESSKFHWQTWLC
jgi:hypothetical protein